MLPDLFVGRDAELATMTGIYGTASDCARAILIVGPGGIGKTWLGLRWSKRHLDQFPDGQLFVDLNGFTPGGYALQPSVVLNGFIGAFGVLSSFIPQDLNAKVGLYRSLVADKRLLVFLDNARDAAQLNYLLPTGPQCVVVVTSRDRLPDLATAGFGKNRLALGPLDRDCSYQLLARRIGSKRLDLELDATTEVLQSCQGFPLALAIAAGRISDHLDFPIAALSSGLSDAKTRLEELSYGDSTNDLSAVLSWSSRSLNKQEADMFALLGATPSSDTSESAAASVAALSANDTRLILRSLENASLLNAVSPGRWRMHDLVHLYARSLFDVLSSEIREPALARLLDHHARTAFACDRLLHPARLEIEMGKPRPGVAVERLGSEAEALEWLRAQHLPLMTALNVAMERNFVDYAWKIAWSLDTFNHRMGHLQDQVLAWKIGLDAATRRRSSMDEALACRRLGVAYSRIGENDLALNLLDRSLEIAAALDDRLSKGHVHRALARVRELQGNYPKALHHALRALENYRDCLVPTWQADALNLIGWYRALLGDFAQAAMDCSTALALHREHHDFDGEANTLDSLAYILHMTGSHDQALAYYTSALDIFRRIGRDYEEANSLHRMGRVYLALGMPEDARRCWQDAHTLYRAQGRESAAVKLEHDIQTLAIGSAD
ncbi:ATP-binding protein [Paractinoplanes rhizophilus]|uniref:ATP-binding protein n=1 Tax=Paractinoplanes rhizophilus TaxID=1416877 RepID=A0ABW2I5K6_9ACTN